MPSLSDVFAGDDNGPEPAGTSPTADDTVDPYGGDPGTQDAGGGTETGGEQDGSGTLIGVMPVDDDTTSDG